MTTAEQILKMIEEVSPDATAKLDEIDALVDCFIANTNFVKVVHSRIGRGYIHSSGSVLGFPKYTRSRDALKAIRQEGWLFTTGVIDIGKFVSMGHSPNEGFEKDYTLKSETLPTEELAELHAIIQAIEYERNNK